MNKILGNWGEAAAAEFLVGLGYEILVRNYRTKWGELDIIARDDKGILFVEVKARKNDSYGTPAMAVTGTKLAKIQWVASQFMAENNLAGPVGIGVVAVTRDQPPELITDIWLT
jgi:putative endonuclease